MSTTLLRPQAMEDARLGIGEYAEAMLARCAPLNASEKRTQRVQWSVRPSCFKRMQLLSRLTGRDPGEVLESLLAQIQAVQIENLAADLDVQKGAS